MPWGKDDAKRRRDNQNYGAGWRRAREKALARDNWRCQIRLDGCQGAATEVDHIVPVSQGGGHDLANLRSACRSCHGKVTAQQGGGFRTRTPRDPPHISRTQW